MNFCIGAEGGEHVKICVLSAEEPYEYGLLNCDINVRAGAFSGVLRTESLFL